MKMEETGSYPSHKKISKYSHLFYLTGTAKNKIQTDASIVAFWCAVSDLGAGSRDVH